MKLLNKKGFILIETLIVTLFVVSLFILVYQNLVPAIGEYEKISSYDDIDSVYASGVFRKVLLDYGDMNYIDNHLENETYLNVSDCNNTNIYKNVEYCKKIKRALQITDEDYIFITKYNIEEFKKQVKQNEFFDSGKLSNFKSYLATTTNTETFFDEEENNTTVGKYRLFITRTVTNADQTTSLKYANIGIYDRKYARYNMGEIITFEPGPSTGQMTFYVLRNSPSSESTVTLILDRNIGNTTTFNSTGAVTTPDSVLAILKNNTATWTNTITLTSINDYVSNNGYSISYNGYQARLLEPNDIYNILGSKIEKNYFENGNSFDITFTNDSQNFLSNDLTGTNGYWMANTVTNNTEMAWTIQDKKIAPVYMTDNTNIGVRPIIVVSKDKLK